MVIVTSGLNKWGKPCSFYLDGTTQRELDIIKKRVTKKNWDYVAIVAGLPGDGKSTFVRGPAKYLDPNFSEKNIVFTADQFIEITNTCPENSAICLDESFEALNTKVSMSKDFRKIINHLQLVRQRHLFIFLLLPDFFSLSKHIAIFRSSTLFVVYSNEDGERGRYVVFGRKEKKNLFIKGAKWINYNAYPSNYRAKFTNEEGIIDEIAYEKAKMDHLLSQNKLLDKKTPKNIIYEFIFKILDEKLMKVEKISKLSKIPSATIYENYRKHRENQ